jgi:hypothetical protein
LKSSTTPELVIQFFSLIVDELEPGNGGRNKRSALRRMAIATSLSFGAMRPDGLIAPYKSKLV